MDPKVVELQTKVLFFELMSLLIITTTQTGAITVEKPKEEKKEEKKEGKEEVPTESQVMEMTVNTLKTTIKILNLPMPTPVLKKNLQQSLIDFINCDVEERKGKEKRKLEDT